MRESHVSQLAGHAAATLHNRWFILGGGNNARGCADLVSLDLGPLLRGSLPAADEARSRQAC